MSSKANKAYNRKLGISPPIIFLEHQVPTVFENYVTDCRVDGKSVQLALWDTAGQEDYERLRPLAYSNAHVILIGFSVASPDSLENVKAKWIEEANERSPTVPVILVGLKKDLREDPIAIEEMRRKSQNFVSSREGVETAHEIGARKYLECSSLTGEGVDDVFETATRETFSGLPLVCWKFFTSMGEYDVANPGKEPEI
ncbi:MAG: Rho GTPase [Trizodia sp. TS-e1964]|nr:MAG: Rho GTPase [Trizodia sp. TS-e1964]